MLDFWLTYALSSAIQAAGIVPDITGEPDFKSELSDSQK
jgi:hypothetical protein